MPSSRPGLKPKRLAALAGTFASFLIVSALPGCDVRGPGDGAETGAGTGTGTPDPAARDRDAATDRDGTNTRQRGDERRDPPTDRSGGMRADDADNPDAGRPVERGEPEPPRQGGNSPPQNQAPPADPGPLPELDDSASIWVVPSNWRERSDNPPMRHATFIVPDTDGDVEVAVSRFPGDVGGELANINRWRGQLGLDVIEQDDIDDHVERFEHPGFEGFVLRIEGEDEHMLAASIYEEAANRTWYVRATASPEAADRIEEAVFAFARSFGQGR